MKKICFILFLFISVTSFSQTFWYPVWMKSTVKMTGIPGTGTLLGIDVSGNVSKVLGVGATGVTGLTPYEILTGDATGVINQSPNFQWSSAFGDNTLSITGTSPSLSISDGSYGGTYTNQKVFFTDGTGAAMDIQYNMIRIIDDDNGSISIFKKDNNSATAYSLYLPPVNGTSGQSLKLNGSLELEWYTPAAGVTGLNDYEPLFGSLTGTIEQDNFWYYDPTTQYMRLGDPSGSAGGEIAVVDGTDASSMTATSIGVSGSVGQTSMNGQYFTLYDLDVEQFSIGRAVWSVDEILLFPAAKGALNQSLQVSNVTGDEVTLSWFTPTSGTVTSFSFTDGSGFDGTVTNATTTPTLALTTTVGDNRVMYSNSGGVTGSSLFTYDDAAGVERLDVSAYDYILRGSTTYTNGLIYADDGGTVFLGANSQGNTTSLFINDSGEEIAMKADNGVKISNFAAGDALTYIVDATDVITPVTLTANDFNFSGGTLSIDYTNGQTANTSTIGFLTDTDWDTFNNKVSFDIHSQASETSLANDDEIPIYDLSEGAINKTTYETLLSPNPTNYRNYRFTYFNEFLNTVGTATGGNDIIATNSGTGAGTNNTATTAANRVGLVRSTTGTTATGRTSPATSSTACAFGGGSWVYEIEINLAALSTVTQRYQLVLGFHDVQNAANQVDAIAFVYDEGGVSTGSAASANWQTLTSSNSTRTWTTSGTAVATGWVNLRIEVNAAASSVSFYVNGTSVATHTTNIPSGGGRYAGFGYLLLKSIGTTASTMDVDYIFCEQDLTTNR